MKLSFHQKRALRLLGKERLIRDNPPSWRCHGSAVAVAVPASTMLALWNRDLIDIERGKDGDNMHFVSMNENGRKALEEIDGRL